MATQRELLQRELLKDVRSQVDKVTVIEGQDPAGLQLTPRLIRLSEDVLVSLVVDAAKAGASVKKLKRALRVK